LKGPNPPDRVGVPVFPELNYRMKSHDLTLSGARHGLSRVLWFDHDSRMVLVDSVEDGHRLTDIDLRKGLDQIEFNNGSRCLAWRRPGISGAPAKA
jgi:hypothetical protein